MNFLLDTDICSAHMRRPAQLAHRFIQYAGGLAIPTIVLAELFAGAYKHPNPPRLLTLISSLAEACQHKPTIDDDRSARDVGTVDAPGPHSQVTLGPTNRRRNSDRHRLLVCFQIPDRAREVAPTEPARSAGRTGDREGRASFGSTCRNWTQNRTCPASPSTSRVIIWWRSVRSLAMGGPRRSQKERHPCSVSTAEITALTERAMRGRRVAREPAIRLCAPR